MSRSKGNDWRMASAADITIQLLREARQGLAGLVECLRQESGSSGSRIEQDLELVGERLQRGSELAESMLRVFCSTPLTKLLNGELLEEHEYHAMRALGVLPDYATLSGLSAEGEYQVYRLLHYPGGRGERGGVIMTSVYRASRRGRGVRPLEVTPVAPERVSRRRLSHRQEDFLRKHFATDYQRMRP